MILSITVRKIRDDIEFSRNATANPAIPNKNAISPYCSGSISEANVIQKNAVNMAPIPSANNMDEKFLISIVSLFLIKNEESILGCFSLQKHYS